MALILSGGDGGNATITGNSGNLTVSNAANIFTGASVVSTAGNITGSNIQTAGLISSTGNITAGNLITAGLISATGNITGGNLITAGTLATATKGISSGSLPAGTILQVVQGIKTDTFSTTAGMGTPAAITGLSANITPTSASSKVLVSVTIGELGSSGDTTYNLILYRGNTAICLGDAAGSRVRSSAAGGIPTTGGTWRAQVPSFSFLDSPATTSATTYTVRVGGNGGVTVTINYDFRNTDSANDSARTPSTITLQEVSV